MALFDMFKPKTDKKAKYLKDHTLQLILDTFLLILRLLSDQPTQNYVQHCEKYAQDQEIWLETTNMPKNT